MLSKETSNEGRDHGISRRSGKAGRNKSQRTGEGRRKRKSSDDGVGSDRCWASTGSAAVETEREEEKEEEEEQQHRRRKRRRRSGDISKCRRGRENGGGNGGDMCRTIGGKMEKLAVKKLTTRPEVAAPPGRRIVFYIDATRQDILPCDSFLRILAPVSRVANSKLHLRMCACMRG